jgi:hypothetical protein
MKPSEMLHCEFPCTDVNRAGFIVPEIEVDPEAVSLVVISEAAPKSSQDFYYKGEQAAFERTSLDAFQAAGAEVSSFLEIIDLGVYFTCAVKCSKTAYGIKAGTIKECSSLLEIELEPFTKAKAFLLMGDVAIKAINYVAKRLGEDRVIPAGSTYKIRGGQYFFRGARAFPSYLQVGPSFGIEKSKQRMITEDIANALNLIK